MSPKPSVDRSVPMSVRDAAVLERTLRRALESYKFQLRTMTALFTFSGTQARFPWSCGLRGDKKRRIFPLSHGSFRPGGSEAQSVVRSCLPAGEFAPAALDAARHAARDVSSYKGSQSRPSTSSVTTQRRPFSSSSTSRGRTQSSSAPATRQRSPASSS